MMVYHRSLGNGKRLQLQDTAAEETNSIYWPSAPTSTTFTVGNDGSNGFNETELNEATFLPMTISRLERIATAIIKCGDFTTDSNGFFTVDLGFERNGCCIEDMTMGGHQVEEEAIGLCLMLIVLIGLLIG